jgi:hypothetical protein
MKTPLYELDRGALRYALDKRSWDSKTLSVASGLNIRTARRVLGESIPNGMPPLRSRQVHADTAYRLAHALRVEPSEIAIDVPPMPESKPNKKVKIR